MTIEETIQQIISANGERVEIKTEKPMTLQKKIVQALRWRGIIGYSTAIELPNRLHVFPTKPPRLDRKRRAI